ncbi:hypothetical protein H6F43_07480 [Leptolyngbya sp. FACHB-36]|uniref:hypothetical protein n=1 Tax=Leptolyngbya sp. FACHB-36 TaxID=2692808 RepID=UPI001681A4C7|nr:hypothetical protein [Leptolyngbya sp. FACHB-36]MBD2020025.1 hypothetical protein [Leptolyngbya sp. FACHB-36]
MINLRRWKSGSALVVALGMTASTIAPLSVPAAADAQPAPYTIAQLFPSSPSSPSYNRRVAIPAGTRIPVQYSQAEKVVVLPTETTPLTLTVARNIRSSSGGLLIPAGSEIRGQLRPSDGGSQFVANEIVFTDGSRLGLNAESKIVRTTREVQPGVSTDAILKGAAIGSGAAAAISGVTGNRRITLGKVLAGTGAGALGGLLLGKRRADVVVVNPNSDLELTLNSSLTVAVR